MKKIREIVRLHLGSDASVRQIATACGIGRSTVSEYVARIAASGLTWPEADTLDEEALSALLLPVKAGSNPRPPPDWNKVREELGRKGVTLKLLWEEYQAGNPQAYSYSRFARMYRRWAKSGDLVMLQHHVAGERLYVDWAGAKLSIADPRTGETSEVSIFVSAMGASQYIFAKAYADEKSPSWLRAHVEAFEFYGGLPRIVVPDNLKTGVEKTCRYEPELNPAYAEMARHYEVAVLPARVRRPKDKAKVENAVQQVERWVLAPLRDRSFFSLAELNDALESHLEKLNLKAMKGPKLSRKQLFQKEDLPAMRPLPDRSFSIAEWKRARLGPDYHVEVEGHRYSAPFRLVSEQLDVRYSLGTVEIFHRGKRVASHHRSALRSGFTTLEEHMPERHRKQGEWTPERFGRWADSIGPGATAFTLAVLASKVHPEHGYRTLLGTLGLEKQFGPQRLNAACARAVSLGALYYKNVKSILDKGLESVLDAPEPPPLPSHDNIRGGEFYAEEGAGLCAN